ncbi:NAD(P)-binding protein [Corynespora cassiicola Philippines]|uniref:NAD(P)-binding protein n=1 Tax=Corynespora cassiicola Philippines TaxID=1448308 RepID=A0A2T2MZW7_CORCC|nr:NAD(P)-binding protein [Corynespora cassiicola Philippines]
MADHSHIPANGSARRGSGRFQYILIREPTYLRWSSEHRLRWARFQIFVLPTKAMVLVYPSSGRRSSQGAESAWLAEMQAVLDCYGNEASEIRAEPAAAIGMKTIALLGSTGFAGPYILASLLDRSDTSTIICLNRSPDAEAKTVSALKRASRSTNPPNNRLHFLAVDISKPNFGLGYLQATLLKAKVDELVFNSWNAHWGLPLKAFEPLLSGMKHAIDFSISSAKRPRLTFVSSICAVGNWPRLHPSQPAIPEQPARDFGAALEHGYGRSKNIAEQLLVQAHRVCGLPIAIMHVGQIGGPSGPELGVWPRQGWLFSLIKTSERLGAFPAQVAPLDWIPIDVLSGAIANVVYGDRDTDVPQVFNLVHPRPVPWNLLLTTLRKRFGFEFESLSLPSWLDKLDERTLKLYGFLRSLGNGRETDMEFETESAAKVLPDSTPITEELLAAWLRGWGLKSSVTKAKM